jgi:pilus assembly protein Flp/PilA
VKLYVGYWEGFMRNLFLEYLKDESGQTSTEYILLVAVAALIVFKFKDVATSRLESMTSKIFDSAETKILGDFK